MKDYNQLYNYGEIENGIINVVIEIPLGSTEKIEWNSYTKEMEVDRLEPFEFPEPVNYGFIPCTVSGDKDALDVLIISDNKIKTGTVIKAKVIGIMKFTDENEIDNKIIAVSIEDLKYNSLNSINDLSKDKIIEITNYFNKYKNYIKENLTKVNGWGDAIEAKHEIYKAIECWKK